MTLFVKEMWSKMITSILKVKKIIDCKLSKVFIWLRNLMLASVVAYGLNYGADGIVLRILLGAIKPFIMTGYKVTKMKDYSSTFYTFLNIVSIVILSLVHMYIIEPVEYLSITVLQGYLYYRLNVRCLGANTSILEGAVFIISYSTTMVIVASIYLAINIYLTYIYHLGAIINFIVLSLVSIGVNTLFDRTVFAFLYDKFRDVYYTR